MYEIIGIYRESSEVLDTTDVMADAQYLKSEYQMAYGSAWIITIKIKN